MQKFLLIGALALATASTALSAAPPAEAWEIGPVIRGKNYSVNMPLRPTPSPRGWSFDFPAGSRDAGHVHYVTYNPGSMEGASRIVVRYRVVARRGTRFVFQENQALPGTVSLFFQRGGDNWTARGPYGLFRWYSPRNTVTELAPGEYEISSSLRELNWFSVVGTLASANPEAFRASLRNASRVGLVFGSLDGGRGHGVFATAPARFELLEFRVE